MIKSKIITSRTYWELYFDTDGPGASRPRGISLSLLKLNTSELYLTIVCDEDRC